MTVNSDSVGEPVRRRVWDAPVRVFHALLIACIAGAWLTRSAEQLDLHAAFGYASLFLLGFRLAWGFVGSAHARFASFAFGPREILAYLGGALRGAPRHYTGHNPAGSVAVFGLLALVAAAVVSGIAAIGAVYGEGPLSRTSNFAFADTLLLWHEGFAWAVLVLAGLHLLGVVWGSFVHRENLAAAMVTGRKANHEGDSADVPARRGVAAFIVAGVGGIALAYLALWSPHDTQRRQADEDATRTALKSQPWTKECGSCHLAYSPAMLPFASWRRTLDEQDRHFGEDLGIGSAAASRLLEHARASPAPSWGTWKLAGSVPAGQAPLEVSATPFWMAAHDSLPEQAFRPPVSAGRHECEACHRDAASGIFHPRMIHMAKGRINP